MTTPRPLWPWLFPATYALHIAEEYRGSFHLWLSRVAGVNLSREDFVALNTAAFAVMTVAVCAVWLTPGAQWLMASLGTIVLVNGVVHLVASVMTRTYSPGLVTGVLLWIPLGVFALRRASAGVSRPRMAAGVLLGLAAHALISGLALTSRG